MTHRAVTYGLLAWASAATLALATRGILNPQPVEGAKRTWERPSAGREELPGPVADRAAMARYALCQAVAVPRMVVLSHADPDLFGFHCGEQARLLRFSGGKPRVQWDFALSPLAPHARAMPAGLLLLDADVDGRRDLLIGQRDVDDRGRAVGGKVVVLRGAERGGYGPPQDLLAAHPLALFGQRLAPDAAPQLAVLHDRDRHLGKGPELWTYAGSDSPPRVVHDALPLSSRMLAHVDLDLDGRDEVLLAADRDGESGLWIWPMPPDNAHPPRFLSLGPLTGAAVGDVDGDGRPDGLIAGRQLWILQAEAGAEARPRPVPGSHCPSSAESSLPCHRDPEVLIRPGLRGAQLKSYVHPEIRLYASPSAEADGTPHALSLEGDTMTVLATMTGDVDRDTDPDLLLLVHPKGRPQTVQLAVLPGFARYARAAFGTTAAPLPQDWLYLTNPL